VLLREGWAGLAKPTPRLLSERANAFTPPPRTARSVAFRVFDVVRQEGHVKDSSGGHVTGAGRLLAFMVGGTAIGVATIFYGLAEAPSAAAPIVLGALCLLSVGTLGLAIGVTQWRRRNLQPPGDAAVTPTGGSHLSEPGESPRWQWQLPVPVLVALVAVWAALLIITIAKARWLGVTANGLLLAASAYSLVQALRRRPTP
jgi:hypothetical protein